MEKKLKSSHQKIIIVSFVMLLVLNCGAAQAQPQQGLMSRLIEIKYSSELYLSIQIKNETHSSSWILIFSCLLPL